MRRLHLTAPGTTEELLPYAWGSFQREPHILTSHHWYWLLQGPEYILPWPLPSASEAQEKAHQEITQIRLRLTKAAEHPISRTYLKILREASFADPEGHAANPESPLPTTIPEEAWSITSAETVTLTVPAGITVSNAAESQETVENKMAKVVSLLPVEFISRESGESETTITVEGVGLTNQAPIVDLENVGSSGIGGEYFLAKFKASGKS